MKFTTAAAAVVLLSANISWATLLTNGNLDLPGLHETDLATGWTLVEPDVDGGGAPVNSATFASFADHTTEGMAGGVGLWYRSFEGGLGGDEPSEVDAHLYQDVAGVAGATYTLSAWFFMETFYPGRDPGAPTQTLLALDFLNGGGLLSSVVLDIDSVYDTVTVGWQQFTVMGAAPAGTTSVRARSSMIDGVFVQNNPQSAFVDDFVLTSDATTIPEPGSAVMLGAAALMLLARRRRRT